VEEDRGVGSEVECVRMGVGVVVVAQFVTQPWVFQTDGGKCSERDGSSFSRSKLCLVFPGHSKNTVQLFLEVQTRLPVLLLHVAANVQECDATMPYSSADAGFI
jgi:hypothetical protein